LNVPFSTHLFLRHLYACLELDSERHPSATPAALNTATDACRTAELGINNPHSYSTPILIRASERAGPGLQPPLFPVFPACCSRGNTVHSTQHHHHQPPGARLARDPARNRTVSTIVFETHTARESVPVVLRTCVFNHLRSQRPQCRRRDHERRPRSRSASRLSRRACR